MVMRRWLIGAALVLVIAAAVPSPSWAQAKPAQVTIGYQVIPNAALIIIGKFGVPDKKGDIDVPFPMHYVLDRDGKTVVKMQGIKGVEAVRAELKKQFK